MKTNKQENIPFSVWASDFRQEHAEVLEHWKNHVDPMRRAVAKIITDEVGGSE